jgi:acyl carrier protein
MTEDEARIHIESALNKILSQKGLEPIQLKDDMRVLGGETQMDSLDLAVLLTEMEQITKKDPFKEGFKEFRTVIELARLYAD